MVRRPPSSGRVRVAMCGRPDVSRRQTFQILRDEVYSCKEIVEKMCPKQVHEGRYMMTYMSLSVVMIDLGNLRGLNVFPHWSPLVVQRGACRFGARPTS